MATGALGQGVNIKVGKQFTSLLAKCLKKFSIVKNYKRTLSIKLIMSKKKKDEVNFPMTNKCHICIKSYAKNITD